MSFRKPAPVQAKRPAPISNPSSSSKQLTSSGSSTVLSPRPSAPIAAPTRAQQSQPKPSKDAEGNINVVVRCRGRSTQEVGHDTTNVASVKPLRGTTVTLTNPALAPTSSMAPAMSTPLTRTYDFGNRPQEGREPLGNVFGPDADQVMLYNDVARPILDQVLHGYNCTIFAYGQTGTGKTFTMEGDLSLTNGISRSAGIIPRTLYSLFAKLAEDKSEFSVRCSFVELYNEELRDLNALEFIPEPVSTSTTVDSRSGMSAPPPSNSLRIYDDKASGSGVLIQGLEETLITSAEEGLKVLKRGSERRQIAATKCNEHSSRSHSIFTITIHIKETSKTGGEDLLKVGKLNLVDLAGSENVGRSGAVQGRAREAGMINASLLALGRVINKLVERQSHIPYRESKLTRLLQDSLGGRTKTTIIATISPVNFEETASTLDYALRAKTIQNRPEVNQRMTKNVLLSQYATEIERLKSDVLAAREKNGIFLSSASWAEMSAEQDQRRIQLEETKKLLEINDAQLETTRDQFEQSLRLLGTREDELRKCGAELEDRRQDLRRTIEMLERTQKALEEEEVLRGAFEKSRKGWKGTASMAMSDVDGLRAKLARKTHVEQANLAVVARARTAFTEQADTLSSHVSSYQQGYNDFVDNMRARVTSFSSRHTEEIAEGAAAIEERLNILAERHATSLSTTDWLDRHGESFGQLVDSARAELLEALAAKAVVAAEQQKLEAEKILLDLDRHARETAAAIESLVAPVRALQSQASQSLAQEMDVLRQVQDQDQRALLDENARLRSVIDDLSAALQAERAVHEEEDAQLVALLSSQLASRSKRHFVKLTEASEAVREGVEDAIGYREKGNNRRRDQMRSMVERSESLSATLVAGAQSMDAGAKEGQASLATSLDGVRTEVASYQEAVQRMGEAQIEVVRRAGADLEAGGAAFRQDASTSKAELVNALDAMSAVSKSGFAVCAERMASLDELVGNYAGDVRSQMDSRTAVTTSFTSTATAEISSLRTDIVSYLSTDIRADLPTGQTPRKRVYPQDRLSSVVDLDTASTARSSVLDRLLKAKADGTFASIVVADEMDSSSRTSKNSAAASEGTSDGSDALDELDHRRVDGTDTDEYTSPDAPAINASRAPSPALSASVSQAAAPVALKHGTTTAGPPILGERDNNLKHLRGGRTRAGR